ncbi:DUF2868 domain-containing protein [Marinobacter orientalis]|uniref:DUF2868 domain-containing protein n=1 Tax=Marinobacter orientalis TaxID=1928859 RepID=A0A7Y0NKS9_9GAMM|nr:DUF2868 domain-containing protein [Marinobacter orientalis]NMT62839.1 DUF2868 domain-containing protein [Marinobacter orientalis]TGX51516.1 DUF2868 domain-containing protein [Marinobacter orientalis]
MPDSAIRRLLEFDRQVQRDSDQSPAFLHRRDRRFALDCRARGVSPGADLWLEHVRRLRPQAPAKDPLKQWRHLTTGFALAGLIFGVMAMLGLLFYDGGQRINLTVILAFVLLQCILAVITTVQAFAGWQPWHWLLRKFSTASHSGALRPLQPMLMARAAHTGGLMFGVAGLLTLLVLVVIQDLAFGWSTTLNTGSDSYYSLLATLATPWQNLWPAAVPDRELVDATRFFRSESDGAADPALWGRWWPFVAMVWTTYVILPRLVLLAVAAIHPGLRARRELARHPGMIALQYRMETPTLDTGNRHNDAADQPDINTPGQLHPLPAAQVLIRWAGVVESELPDTLSAGYRDILAAGGNVSLEHDHRVLDKAGQVLAASTNPAAVIVTHSWEPPTGELADFLSAARNVWPSATLVALVPVATQPEQRTPDHQLSQWLRFADRCGDSQIVVSTPDVASPQPRIHRALPDGYRQ